MKNKFFYLTIVFVVLLLSCGDSSFYEKELARIKQVGDAHPELAMQMLDSLKTELGNSSEYIQRKADLLEVRLKDKAYIPATSDIRIKGLVAYFEEDGTFADKMEAYYYAGSTYRDLHDTPRALEHFFKVVDAFEDGAECDSVLMRNTYSNLYWLYVNVQDYQNALDMALKEYELDLALENLPIVSANHVAVSYFYLDAYSEAEKYYMISLEQAEKNMDRAPADCIPSLLYGFSTLKNTDAAQRCLALLDRNNPQPLAVLSMAVYYESQGIKDSADVLYRKLHKEDMPLLYQYDAARHLLMINKERNPQVALRYAMSFLKLCDSLNLGKRQQLAATVNNQHKYYRDMVAEQEIIEENVNYRLWITVGSFCFVLLLLVGVIFYICKKYHMSKIIIAKNEELMQLRANKCEMEKKIHETEAGLNASRELFRRSSDKLQRINEKIQKQRNELDEKNAELEAMKKELAERVKQAAEFMHMLHQTELSASAEDIINNVRQASAGKYQMSPTDWSMLFKAVDKRYPEFGDQLINRLTKFNEHQKQLLYLLRIGLTKPQIENITNLSHSTVWRWTEKYRDKLGDLLFS